MNGKLYLINYIEENSMGVTQKPEIMNDLKVKRWAVVMWDKKKLSTSTYNTDDTQYVCALKTSDKHWWK